MRDIDRVAELVSKFQEILYLMQVSSEIPMVPVIVGGEEVEMAVGEPLATHLVEALELLDEFTEGSTELEFTELNDEDDINDEEE